MKAAKKKKLKKYAEAWGVKWDEKAGRGKLVQLYAVGHVNGVPFETGPKPDEKTARKIQRFVHRRKAG